MTGPSQSKWPIYKTLSDPVREFVGKKYPKRTKPLSENQMIKEPLVPACLKREAIYRLNTGDCGKVLGRDFCLKEDVPIGLTPKHTTGGRQGGHTVPPNPPHLLGHSESTREAQGEKGPGLGARRTGSYDERWFQSLFVQAPADRRGEMASLDWKRNDNPSHHIVELVVPLCAGFFATASRPARSN